MGLLVFLMYHIFLYFQRDYHTLSISSDLSAVIFFQTNLNMLTDLRALVVQGINATDVYVYFELQVGLSSDR